MMTPAPAPPKIKSFFLLFLASSCFQSQGGNVMNLEMGTGLGEGLRPGVVASNRGFLAPSARAVLLEIAEEDTV